jgi:hypothetical protein
MFRCLELYHNGAVIIKHELPPQAVYVAHCSSQRAHTCNLHNQIRIDQLINCVSIPAQVFCALYT